MVHVNVGDVVTLLSNNYPGVGAASWNMYPVVEDHPMRVSRVYSETAIVRGHLRNGIRSVSVPLANILTVNGVDPVSGATPRKLGTKPDDTEEMVFIGIDHPGIQWLFEDMAKYADRKSWCPEYDRLARSLGIPARKKAYTATVEFDGVHVTSIVMAHSREEAEEKLRHMVYGITAPTT